MRSPEDIRKELERVVRELPWPLGLHWGIKFAEAANNVLTIPTVKLYRKLTGTHSLGGGLD